MTNTARSQEPVTYLPVGIMPPSHSASEDTTIANALHILRRRVMRGSVLTSPQQVKDYLALRLGPLDCEVFTVLFLDAQHGVIAVEEMFRGTLTQTSVYPREVVKAALRHNAAAVILSHNHPSGGIEPSRADEFLTQTLKSALALIDVRVLDHIVVGGGNSMSMGERGLL